MVISDISSQTLSLPSCTPKTCDKFWKNRIEFLLTVKGYLKVWHKFHKFCPKKELLHELKENEKRQRMEDRIFQRICRPFWPSVVTSPDPDPDVYR